MRIPRDLVALVLAIGLASALNILTIAVCWAAFSGRANSITGGISENATQILTGWGGGIVGILGAMFGYRVGQQEHDTRGEREP